MISVYTLSEEPRFNFYPNIVMSPQDAALVDQIWNQLLIESPSLTNDRILIAQKVDSPIFHVSKAPYQLFAAARRDPGLANRLKLRPIAVSGILTCEDGIVMGKRANRVTQYPGFWEMVPSGGVTLQPNGVIDLKHQIQEELREEIGIADANVGAPLGWIDDNESGVIDFILPISTNLRMSEILKLSRTNEYSGLKAVQNITTFLAQTHNVLPVTCQIAHKFIV
jgi:hypothetical protein